MSGRHDQVSRPDGREVNFRARDAARADRPTATGGMLGPDPSDLGNPVWSTAPRA